MGSNSISNNSNNIRVNSNYTNKKYGSTIGKSGGSSQAALASRARTANTEEFDLSSPTVIAQKEKMVKKSEIIEQIENLISFFDNSKKTLEEEKENLIKKSKSFTDSANRGEYPELYWEENVKGRKKYLNPKEAIKSDKYFKKYLKDNGYPTDRERMSSEKYNSLKEEYANYINTTYTEKYNEYFSKALDMSYEKYVERLTQLSCEIEQLKASRYEMLQRLKEQPYIELMDTDDFKNYVANNKDNPNSELYKLYGIKNGTITMDDDSYWRFKYFTEQDMLIFSYLWDMQSPKAAREYVDAIEDKLNKVEGYANAEKFLDSIRDENGNIDPDVRAGVLSGAKGFENGVSTFFDGLGNAFSDEGMMSTTQYEQMYILNELTNSSGNYISKLANEIYAEQGEEVANDFLKKMYNSETNEIDLEYAKTMLSEQEYNNLIIKIDTDKKSRLDNVYELGSSFGNMAPTLALAIAVSFVAPGAGITIAGKTFAFNTLISSGLMGLSVGGNAKNQALMQGNDLYISTVYGLASGFSEASLGLLLGNIPGLSATAEFSIIGLLKEGGEEALQEGVDALLRSVLLGETIDYDQLPKDMIKSFCYGVIMSGITNGGKFAFSIVMGNETIKINSMDDFLNFVKNNVVGLSSAQVESDVVETTHSNDNVTPSIDETVEQSSSINPRYSDIDKQIVAANNKTRKGIFASIDVTDITMMTDEVLAKIDNVDSVRFRLPDGSEVSYNEFLIMRNNTIGGTEPLQFHNKLEVARNFDDAKQIAYLELRKLFDINDVESIPKDLWSVFYKLDVNGEILYVDKDGKPTTSSEGHPAISSQSTINDDIIFAAAEKYLSPELVSEINGYRTDPNNNIERLKKIKTVKSVIEGYTHKNGPAIAAFLRKNIVKFLSAEYDGNNPGDLENMINKSDAANGRTDISDFRMKDHVAVMDHAIASSSPTKKAMDVYRGVDELFDGNTMLDPKSLEIGQVISDKAFLSTTLLPTTSITDSRNIMIKIKVPEGSKGLYVESLTGVAGYGQQEFLLPRDSKLRVTDHYFEDPVTGKIFLEMELLPNNDSSIGVDLPFIIKEKMGILSREDFTRKGASTGKLSTAELNVTEVKGEGSEPTFELPENELSTPKISSEISFDNLSFLRVLNFDLIKVKDSFAKYYERIRTSEENGQRYRVNENTQVDFADMIKDFYDMGYLKVLNESMVDMNNSNAYNPELSNQEHGVDHAERVLTFASYIGLKSDLSAREMSILIESSKWHDCGRVLVANDTEHAIKSAAKIKDLIGERYSIRDIDMIKAAIELHEIDEGKCNYDEVFNSVCNKYSIDASDKNSLRVISDILKDADALDRLRFTFGNLDPTLLRKEISLNLIKASCQLQEARGFSDVSGFRDQNVVNILRQKGWSDYEISYGFKHRSDIIARAIQ